MVGTNQALSRTAMKSIIIPKNTAKIRENRAVFFMRYGALREIQTEGMPKKRNVEVRK
jgi:hypothetical protein